MGNGTVGALLLLCFTAGQINTFSFFHRFLHLGEMLFLSPPQVSWQEVSLWTCAPPATPMPHVRKRRMAREKFVIANTGLSEMEGLSVQVRKKIRQNNHRNTFQTMFSICYMI